MREIILSDTKEWIKATAAIQNNIDRVHIMLAWIPPVLGVVKLNVDGSRKDSTGAIGAGGVLRDHLGQWLGGFAVNLGKGKILEAELWGLFFGLKLAVEKQVDDVVIEMDSAIAVKLIQNAEVDNFHPTAGLVSNCKRIMNQFRRVDIQHIYRERNSVADGLATWSHNLDMGYWYLDDSPVWIGNLLTDDSLGVAKTRLINVV
ncbi:hypothetical protein CerSpe_205870 [Prunus speciosa]